MNAFGFCEPGSARWPLLAESGQLSQMANGLRNDGGWIHSPISDWLLLMSIVAIIGFAIWLLLRRASLLQRLWQHSPRRLFGQLCRAHRLDWTQRRLLRRLAKSQGMDQAARLFLEPDRFSSAAAMPELQPLRDRIENLRRKLFCENVE